MIFKNLFDNIDIAKDGIEALNIYNDYFDGNNKYHDIIISDIHMPRLNGIDLTKKIFEINKNQNIIIVSAYNDKEYLIDLINIGVDAFMQKPLSSENILEVLYKVCHSFNENNIIHLDEHYKYDGNIKTLFLDNEKIELSDNELKLLDLLITNNNKYFNSVDIFNHIYFDDPDKEFSPDSIKSLIKRVRKKLPSDFILNTINLGYRVSFH